MEIEDIPLIQKLEGVFGGEYKFKLKSAFLNESADFCVIEIYYRDGIILSTEKKNEIENFILSLLPKKFKYDIKLIKNFVSEERVAQEFSDFLKKNYPSISFKLEGVKGEGKLFKIDFLVDYLSFEQAKLKKLDRQIEKQLKAQFDECEFECSFSASRVATQNEQDLIKESYKSFEPDDSDKLRKIEFLNEEPLVGKPISEPASYIKDKTSPEENVVLCGRIKFVSSHVLKTKPRKKKDETSGEEKEKAEVSQPKYERKLYKFEIEDFTGEMACVFFSNKENQPKLESLNKGDTIAARGKIEEDKFLGGVNFVVSDISYCSLPEKFEEVISYHSEKPFYEFVKPEPVVIYKQDDLLNFENEKQVPKFLQGKTFVCYDFETTGLHFDGGDKIIEIGAVKIVDGKITERFMSYVNPERPIPASSSSISGIVDADVKDAPKDAEVLGDFYKFTRGSTLIGYNNINFDNVFLIGQGKKCRWNFEQETDDVYRLAQKYVHGVRNYKLGTIAEKLGVVLDNAHRAVYDAQATAEVFIKIAEIMEMA